MSNSAFTRIDIDKATDFIKLLSVLLGSAWKMEFNGKVNYVPLGKEFGEWTIKQYNNDQEVLKEVERKIDLNEDIAISLFYDNLATGVDIIFKPGNSQVTFGWNINRIEESSGKLDFLWYTDRLKKSLQKEFGGKKLLSFEYDSGAQLIQSREDTL
ncbi:hypothetical protein [Oligoflexus tunisiensis]|uniref:hypothetical protein n=1 Tax=Oligoflexus tunisiensis TaxID=708132 RepID=UPI00114CF490|nr:hypothetical protein [Oligoflexus tunisiensis]